MPSSRDTIYFVGSVPLKDGETVFRDHSALEWALRGAKEFGIRRLYKTGQPNTLAIHCSTTPAI